jgi:peptide/nickel transport system substrate-binding protein
MESKNTSKNMRKQLKLWIGINALLCFVLIPFIFCFAAEQPRRGGTLVAVTAKDPSTLNPALTAEGTLHHIIDDVIEGLVEVDGNWDVHPGLADSWDISPDGLRVTFHLAKDVRWHDGKPFTSKDVQFSLMEVAKKYSPVGNAVMANVRSIETPDEHTAIFLMDKVYAPLVTAMVPFNCPIIPRHLYEGTDILKNPHNVSNPIGTGAFKFKEWVRADHMTLVRNDDYHKAGLPYLDRIIFQFITDPSARALAFEKGEVDLLGSGACSMQDFERLAMLPNVTPSRTPGDTCVVMIAINQHDNKILANKKVRQAIYHAIDRQFISDKARYGVNPPLDTPIPDVFESFHNPNVRKYEYNLAKANKFLDEAGYPLGANAIRFKLRLVHEHGIGDGIVPSSQMIKPMLKKVGIEVEMVPMERPVMFEKAFKKYDFDLFTTSYGAKMDPAIGVSRAYTTESIQGTPFSNVARYSNSEVDKLFQEAAQTMDQKKRAIAYQKIQEILTEDLPYLWLYAFGNMDTQIARSTFKNVFVTINSPEYTGVWWTGKK